MNALETIERLNRDAVVRHVKNLLADGDLAHALRIARTNPDIDLSGLEWR